MSEKEEKFCVKCKHCKNISNDYFCFSPRNGRDIVTGEKKIKVCRTNRDEAFGDCKKEGLLFEAKDKCSYA